MKVPTPFPTPQALLKKHGFSAKKSWGQNYLTSEKVYRAIVDATVTDPNDWIVEIGAGLGTLTMRLAQRVPDGKVIAVEKENDMLTVLKSELEHLENVDIHSKNALHYSFSDIQNWCGQKINVCGNLPYHISSQILFRILDFEASIKRGVFMLQKEMADRVISGPGNKTYGALSVLIQAHANTSSVINVEPGAFTPQPKVKSKVIALDFKTPPKDLDIKRFRTLVKLSFATRRKTILNNLKDHYPKTKILEALEALSIASTRRPETISVDEFITLSKTLPSNA